ncbi:hypothetical protein AFLA_009227 [Aspergillus flavus NRRL3357]|nr:hypothetical protein AFLA_009227 [Aspergillus flavus NRRL3357]
MCHAQALIYHLTNFHCIDITNLYSSLQTSTYSYRYLTPRFDCHEQIDRAIDHLLLAIGRRLSFRVVPANVLFFDRPGSGVHDLAAGKPSHPFLGSSDPSNAVGHGISVLGFGLLAPCTL